MVNTSNYIGNDNPPWLRVQPARTATATGAPTRAAVRGRRPGGRIRGAGLVGGILSTIGTVLLSWLAAIPRRLGDRLFAMNDTEAYWWSWQIIKTRGGLARSYRDVQFETLAACPQCRGSGATTALPCPPCLGTGRITLGEVS